jgi:hypothetical protein
MDCHVLRLHKASSLSYVWPSPAPQGGGPPLLETLLFPLEEKVAKRMAIFALSAKIPFSFASFLFANRKEEDELPLFLDNARRF